MSNPSKAALFFLSESPEAGPSVVVHTTVTFGSEHLDSDPAEVQQIILSHLQRIVPSLPKPSSIKCQKWRYSQVLPGGTSQLGGPAGAVLPILRQQEERGWWLNIRNTFLHVVMSGIQGWPTKARSFLAIF